MYFSIIWIITFALYIASIIGIILISTIFTKPIDEYNFSFKRIFPFEVTLNSKIPNVYKVVLYLFVALSFSPAFCLVDTIGKLQNISGFSILIICILGIDSILFTFLHIFDPSHVKTHLVLFTLFLSFTFLGNALVSLRSFVLYKAFLEHSEKIVSLLIIGVLAVIFAIFALIVGFNPKLKMWAKMDKVEGKEDEYKRPKNFPLAYSEWLIFLLLVLGEIIYFVELTIQ